MRSHVEKILQAAKAAKKTRGVREDHLNKAVAKALGKRTLTNTEKAAVKHCLDTLKGERKVKSQFMRKYHFYTWIHSGLFD